MASTSKNDRRASRTLDRPKPSAPSDAVVAGKPGFGVGRDGVDVQRRDCCRELHLLGASPLERFHQENSTLASVSGSTMASKESSHSSVSPGSVSET